SLKIGLIFDELLRAAVEEPDMRIDAGDHFAIKVENEPQNAMRGGVLRPEIKRERAFLCFGHGDIAPATDATPRGGRGSRNISTDFDRQRMVETVRLFSRSSLARSPGLAGYR